MDFIRAFSLLVVVAWHWVFTIIIWRDDGPHASNPIGFTKGLWIFTWTLQIMPMFFYVGGYGHLRSWEKAQAEGRSIWELVGARAKRLAIPAGALLGVWIVIGIVLSLTLGGPWVWRAVTLVVSPLWFMAVYLMLVLLLPIALWLHRRFDTVALVVMAGVAGLIDVARFRYDWDWLGIFNMVIIWGLCHQFGFFYERIVAARRTLDWTMLFGGGFALAGLVGSGLYPGSMVGVPGERSNMAPPTMCIVALLFLQAGIVEIIRPAVSRRLERPGWATVNDVINRFSLPLFLFHTTGMALSRAIGYAIDGDNYESTRPTLGWWLGRPFAVVGPLLCTLPVIYLFGRKWAKADKPAERVREPVTVGARHQP
ncbi:acyltransferase family protein [Desertimonas flava]|uniref:acyltransferase family protein n=1 Tax=Desertimonas flava TaxID=2064846 RepID=UPI001969804E|nr:acyltransferase [Desertimonas flava]